MSAWAVRDVTGGGCMVGAAALGFLWANSPWQDGYLAVAHTPIGPGPLRLSPAGWAADGLLAVFFFMVGLELKRELTSGSLRNPRAAAVPAIAAVGGMLTPALVYLLVVLAAGQSGSTRGWAIPTATDIAFAVTVLALFGRGLPAGLRVFLLTLAVVDDLLAIVVIAVFYGGGLRWWPLLAALAAVGLFALAVRGPRLRPALLLPAALAAWVLMHESGVHATIAGVLLGSVVPAHAVHDEPTTRAARLERAIGPVSSVIALPVFAFFAAGVPLDSGGVLVALTDPVALAILLALVGGKLVGVLGTTALVVRLTPCELPGGLALRDLLPLGFLSGIGFTVSLLIVDLSFGATATGQSARVAVLTASCAAATLAAIALRRDARRATPSGA